MEKQVAGLQFHPVDDDFTMAYWDLGEGEPLLMLHGFTGTARTHMGGLMEALGPTYRILAPDLRGYGRSRPPNRTFPVDFYQRDAADAARLLEAVGCGPAHVLGFSDGAESALLLAANRPDLVRSVVAWGVSGVISDAMVESVAGWLPVSAWGEERAEWRAEIRTQHGPEQFPTLIEGWVQGARAIHAAGGNICLSEAAAIPCPVLLINGVGEVGNTPADVAALAARIPDCRLEIVAGAGHGVHEEQPARFLALVNPFLAAPST